MAAGCGPIVIRTRRPSAEHHVTRFSRRHHHRRWSCGRPILQTKHLERRIRDRIADRDVNLRPRSHTHQRSGDQQRSTFLAKRIDRQRPPIRSLRLPVAALGHQVQRQNIARECPCRPSIVVRGNRRDRLCRRDCWQEEEDKDGAANSYREQRRLDYMLTTATGRRPRRRRRGTKAG